MSRAASRICVVDDDPSVRCGLERLLRASGLDVCTYGSAQEFLDGYDPSVAGCLVLDLAMPGIGGLELQDVLAARGGAPPTIFLTGHAEVADSVRAMKHGAVEFLTKPVDEPALIDAVRSAVEKDRVDRAKRAELAEIRRRLATLTRREAQVLRCVVAGKLNKQTAVELGTVEKTIKVHRARVMEKMQVPSLAALIRLTTLAESASAHEA